MRSLPEALMQAVYELATVQPHVPEDARFTGERWRDYWRGYYAGVQRALQVMQLALDRWTLRQRERRRRARAERRDTNGLIKTARMQVVETVAVAPNHVIQERDQRRNQVHRKSQAVGGLRGAVNAPQVHKVRARFAIRDPLNSAGEAGFVHSAQYVLDFSESPSETVSEKTRDFTKENAVS
jgi:hypothetical protein